MGYHTLTLQILMDMIKDNFSSFNDIHMLELGNQFFELNEIGPFLQTFQYNSTSKLSKHFFDALNINCISIDINKEDDTYYCNLKENSNDSTLLNNFNLITDLGTLEHVGQYEPPEDLLMSQYTALKNIHNFGKLGCIYYHIVPLKGHWYKHGACDYTPDFWTQLCLLAKYDIVNSPFEVKYRPDILLGIIYKKTEKSSFPSFEQFCKLPGLRSTAND